MFARTKLSYAQLAKMDAVEFERRVRYSISQTGTGSQRSIRIKYFYVTDEEKLTDLALWDEGATISGYGAAKIDNAPPERFPGDKASFKVSYGPMTLRSELPHPSNLKVIPPPGATPGDIKATEILFASYRLFRLVAQENVNFTGHPGTEAVFADGTPYRFAVPKPAPGTKMAPPQFMVNHPLVAGKYGTHKATKDTPPPAAETSGCIPVGMLSDTWNDLSKKFHPELILAKYPVKPGQPAPKIPYLTFYMPQLDYRTAQKPDNGCAVVYVPASVLPTVLAKSLAPAGLKPALQAVPITRAPSGKSFIELAKFRPWEILGAPKDFDRPQPRAIGQLTISPEIFLGSQKVFRFVVEALHLEGFVEQKEAAPEEYVPSAAFLAAQAEAASNSPGPAERGSWGNGGHAEEFDVDGPSE
jgi:hypothetical protein